MKKIFFIFIFYIFILFLAAILPKGISDYNAFVLLVFCLLYVWLISSIKIYIHSSLCFIIMCIISLHHTLLYTFIDIALTFFILGSLHIGVHFSLREREFQIIKTFFLFICLFSIIGVFSPLFYQELDGDVRYMGLFHAINFSANIFSILEITIWEIEKKKKRRTWILFFLITSLLIYIGATRTRSLLFVLPYWIYQLLHKYNKFKLITALSFISIFYLPTIINILFSRMHLEEKDGSFVTRSLLYSAQISGIIENYIVIPHGSHTATELAIDVTQNPNFTPHNDFLRYIYEWGGFFFIFFIFILSSLKKTINFNKEFFFILLAMASYALHNMLFATYIWIPFILILMVRRNDIKKYK